MTEHSKIPVPPADGPDARNAHSHDPASPAARTASLIERAVTAFDLGKLAPPPMPDRLAPPVIKPAMRHPRPQVLPPEQAAPQDAPQAVPVPETVAPSAPVAAPSQAVEAVVPSAPPVVFRGVSHPVDRTHLREQGLIVPEGSITALMEEFRIIKRQLLLHVSDMRRAGMGAAAQRILICSAHPGEGKTYCAVNLALSIAAEKESEVLLVDADFAKPSVLSSLGLPGGPGLMDALIDPRSDVADFVIGTDVPGLWVLPAGNGSATDSEHLNASRTSAVLDRLTQGSPHRIVIFDSPPVLAASPAAELAKHVGQAVVIVRADRTGQGALEDTVSLLAGCRNIELLLNAVNFSPSGRRFGTYYGYRD